ncbi:MAG: hypothetical protein ACYDGR_14150 [Candidatus Dormibacteria bacterium]
MAAYVIIRRFRTGEGIASTRAFRSEAEARKAAETWCAEGWEVEIVPPGGRGGRQVLKLREAGSGRPESQ